MPDSNNQKPLPLFLHIRKAGGTTLKEISERHYEPDSILRTAARKVRSFLR